jgi:hypothetical protein
MCHTVGHRHLVGFAVPGRRNGGGPPVTTRSQVPGYLDRKISLLAVLLVGFANLIGGLIVSHPPRTPISGPDRRYPEALALAKRHTANQWMLGDQLLSELGKPPKFFTTCRQRIEDEFPDQEDDAKRWAHLWKVADAFPAEARRDVGIEVHIAAGLQAASSFSM